MVAPYTQRIRRGPGPGMCQCGCTPWWVVEEAEATQRGKGPAQRTDEQMKSTIEEILTEDPWLDASGIQVSVQQGIAQLSGTVTSRQAKRRAENLADQVRGVRDVQNTLVITGL